MAIIVDNVSRFVLVVGITVLLAGCGLAQNVSNGSAAVTKSIFYKQVKTLRLDIRAREAVNPNDSGVALPTVVRIYQLKDRTAFDRTDYLSLFTHSGQVLKTDLLAEKEVRLQPGGTVMVSMPINESTQYVAVAGMFLSPDQVNNTWRVVLSRNDLHPDKFRIIEAGNNQLVLRGIKGD
ncbi:type VI secretion system-associated lipoprotein [Mangrovibacter phragmitis]|jgi:type VI secretion system protein VasD|uniref:Type VI secretion system-associated lipoprotein n=1 Tax=Mangrovibacter phragmitis TaxID=1691903 RepID=A0A1B7LA12_9ENTR|nr:type VI secretion system lipoprotein TssJ [Mangrovibacter phragmitis]OAT79172.1 type VI secretion system-associated lipoprotein [Mangrovibacter phragmitis]